jgi:hypothetical protein
MLSTVAPPAGSFAFCDGCAASSGKREGTLRDLIESGTENASETFVNAFPLGRQSALSKGIAPALAASQLARHPMNSMRVETPSHLGN